MQRIKFMGYLRLVLSAIIIILYFGSENGICQTNSSGRNISGRVLDEEGAPAIGVAISAEGISNTYLTDVNGRFSITNLPSTVTSLNFSYLGFETQKLILIENRSEYTVNLKSSLNSLDEVVVIGYGSALRKDLTGSVGEVPIDDLKKAPVPGFAEALAGRVAGVQVISGDGQPGADLQIIVRGNNSVTQDNSPLYVLDGFPLEEPISNVVNMEEIESIEILKDASATAIYGARGANGVIMVTTKKGKIGEPVVSYQGWAGLHQNLNEQEMMNPYEFVRLQLEKDPITFTPTYLNNGKTLESYRSVEGVDWQDEVIRNGWAHNHSLSIRGGSDKTKYSISGSVYDQEGVILNSGFRRYQGRVVLDQTVSKKIKTGINLNYSAIKKYGQIVSDPQDGGATASLMYSIWGYRPVSGGDNEDGLLGDLLDEELIGTTDLRVNPYITTLNEYNPLFTNSLIANAYLELKPLKDITVRISGGTTISNAKREVFNNSQTRSGNPRGLRGINGSINNTERSNLLNENTVTYSKRIARHHSLKILGGITFQQQRSLMYGYSANQLPNESLGINGIDQGIVSSLPTGKSSNTLMSYLGRINYSYKSKYLATLSYRADGSSKFSDGNKWAYFPSGSLAWRLSQEDFIKNITWISDAKVRAGYGLTGNNRVGDFPYQTPLNINLTSAYAIGNAVNQGMVPMDLGNLDLQWETTAQMDVGIDVSLFKNRIQFTADYYKKVTSDLLLQATIPPSTGFLAGLKNVGKVSNHGFEFSLNTVNVQKENFNWTTGFNIAFNRNKVLQLNEGEANLPTRVSWSNYGNAFPYIAIPGQPIALFYGHIFDGIYQVGDFDQQPDGSLKLKPGIPGYTSADALIEPGYIRYKDLNGDGLVNNDDLTTIGNPNPDHIGGLINNFVYKNFDLSVFFQWSVGNDLLNANRYEFEGSTGRNMLNHFATFADRWTPENESNTQFKLGGQGPLVYSSRVIEDGSFLRFKTLSFGYTLPKKVISKIGINAFRVYAAAQNLAVWTNYSGMDPEVSVRSSALTPGFDWSAYPRTRTITLGLNLTL